MFIKKLFPLLVFSSMLVGGGCSLFKPPLSRGEAGSKLVNSEWELVVHSVKNKEVLRCAGFMCEFNPPEESLIFLLVDIEIKYSNEESVVITPQDLVLRDSQEQTYMPIGIAPPESDFPDFLLAEGPAQTIPLQTQYRDGSVKTYSFPEGSWTMTIESPISSIQMQQTFIYLVPSDAQRLTFQFRELFLINLGQ